MCKAGVEGSPVGYSVCRDVPPPVGTPEDNLLLQEGKGVLIFFRAPWVRRTVHRLYLVGGDALRNIPDSGVLLYNI